MFNGIETQFLTMIIQLDRFDEPKIPFEKQFQPNEIAFDAEIAKIEKPLNVEGTLHKQLERVVANGSISGEIEIECARCLTEQSYPLNVVFEEVFVTEDNFSKREDVHLHGDELEFSIYNGNDIDVSEIVREEILLNLPNHFVCKEDCQGLCLKCGANKNLKPCSCEEKEIDPRWAALKNLK